MVFTVSNKEMAKIGSLKFETNHWYILMPWESSSNRKDRQNWRFIVFAFIKQYEAITVAKYFVLITTGCSM